MIDPVIKMTVEVLEAAARAKTVRRVVITSSGGILLSWEYIISNDVSKVFNGTYNRVSVGNFSD
jgi:nucleoside-diphosphate-sugar epimerase